MCIRDRVMIVPTNPKAVDLKQVLTKGNFLIMGVTNNCWYKEGKKQPLKYPKDPVDGPVVDPSKWIHSIAIVNGTVFDPPLKEPLSSLSLRDDNQPDPKKGYMRSIHRVYRVTKCSNPGTGCRGACAERQGE